MNLPTVVAIDDGETFWSDERLRQLHEGIHLFPTDSLRRGMIGPGKLERLRCFSFRSIFNEWMDGRWEGKARLLQYAALGRVLANLPSSAAEPRKSLLRAFRRGKAQVLDAIRALSEAGIEPSGLSAQTPTDQLLVEVWAALEREGVGIQLPRQIGALASGALPSMISQQTRIEDGPPSLTPAEAANRLADVGVVFHGFYFITPPQYRFLHALLTAGYRVTFVVMFDQRYPGIFDIWNNYFGKFPLLPSIDHWVWMLHAPTLPRSAHVFGTLSCGRELVDDPSEESEEARVKVRQFRNLGQMIPSLIDPGKATVYGPELESLRELVESYAPTQGKPSARHFFAYPIGQFLLCLYRLWRPEEGRIVLDEESLRLVFSSGLLRLDGVEARALYRPLERVLPFFSDCREVEAWLERLDRLEALYRERVAGFEAEMPPGAQFRFHQALGSPLRLFSHLSLTEEELGGVSKMLRRFIQIAQRLLQGGEISILSHLEELNTLLDTRDIDSSLTDKERALLKGLRAQLTGGQTEDIRLMAEDLGAALAWFLGNVEEDEEGSEESHIQLFASLDALPFCPRPAHLILLSEAQFPRSEGSEPPWPLSARSLEEMAKTQGETVMLLVQRQRSVMAADIFMFFLGLAWSPELTLSWTEEWQGSEHSPSPCLMMLLDARWMIGAERSEDIPGWTTGLWPARVDHAQDLIDLSPRRQLADPVLLNTSAPPRDVAVTWNLCPRRAVFSYVLERFPTFSDDLHQSFLIGKLTSRLAAVCEEPLHEVYQQCLALLPQWPEIEAKASLEASSGDYSFTQRRIRDWDELDERSYPQARGALLFLNPGISTLQESMNFIQKGTATKKLVESMAIQMAQRGTADLDALPTAKSGEHCMFCPFRLDCTDAKYWLDLQQESE